MAQETYPQLQESEKPKGLSNEEFGELVLSPESRDRIYHTAVRVVRNVEDAKDVMQETLLRAWRNRSKFENRSHPGTWIHRIVINVGRTALSRSAAQREHPTEDYDYLEKVGDVIEPLDEVVLSRDQAQLLDQVIDETLSEKLAMVVRLRAHGFTHQEIAEELGIEESAVKVRSHRGHRALKDALDIDEWRQ